jgi:hypothetical protein
MTSIDATKRSIGWINEYIARGERPDDLGEVEISVTPPVRPSRDGFAAFEEIGVHRVIPLTPAATEEDVVRFVQELGQLV